MTLAGKFLRLPSHDRRLVLRAALLLGGIRLGLSLLPFTVLRGLLARVSVGPSRLDNASRSSVDRPVWAVAAAGRYVPKATCLVQALALQVLLMRQGYGGRLCIGVAKGQQGRLEAHAWVESQGRVLLGGAICGRYTPLPALEGAGR
jgi:Transglutaminase-like superfamily